ncbi:EF-hand domain-containing protein [Blastopirellula sp. J2-11]|uniref:EF-hand domain-containing protein n=1 Tax=Blastopirellula sp. J2-11 TaxID=2943192 RepID=UPI0021CA684F|nr:EF-hand domain-containing protein [Blastopirellula sp. J2-11]UUO09037.1 EF-hand domain-containing protein [Blastopirellula sp. J2-11]
MTRAIQTWTRLAILLALIFPAAALAEPTLQATSDDRTLLISLNGDNSSETLEFVVTADGQAAAEARHQAYHAIFVFFDADQNGRLSKAEAALMPTPFGLRQIASGRLLTTSGPLPQTVDRDGDGDIQPDELAQFYDQSGCGGCVVTYGADPHSEQLTAALRERLALASEGPVSYASFQQAALGLKKLDGNNDELISPGELLASARYPGASAARLILPMSEKTPAEKNRHAAGICRIDFSSGEVLIDKKQVAWRKSDRVWTRIHTTRGKHAASLDKLEELTSQLRQLQATRYPAGVPIDQLEGVPNASELRSFLRLIDANDDGRATSDEGERWSNVYRQLVKLQPVVAILDLGDSLFALLDENHDGSLSQAELANSGEQAASVGLIQDQKIAWDRLPRQYRVVVANGLPQSLLDQSPVAAPTWFQAMDRNGDGLVSRGEFLADDEQFQRLDQNGDGYVSPIEL